MTTAELMAVMSGVDTRLRARALRLALSAASGPYGLAVAARNAAFDHGWATIRRLSRPVVSIGNLTTGGTGKTPMVTHLVRSLIQRGMKPAILLRGYRRGRGEESDEAVEYAASLASESRKVPIGVGGDRYAVGSRLVGESPETDVFVLDDGFQHRMLARDLDVVLVDATQPFGFGHLLPRGLLRESRKSLSRADVVIVTRTELTSPDRVAELARQLGQWTQAPVLQAAMSLTGIAVPAAGMEIGPDQFSGKRVLAFSGIGNPGQFESHLRKSGGQVLEHLVFADHHPYSEEDTRRLAARATAAEAIVTTAKDWARLGEKGLALHTPATPLWVARIGVSFADGHEAQLLDRIESLTRKQSP